MSPQTSANEIEIRKIIDDWAQAVRNQNDAGIRKDHDPDILMFDVPPPFQSRGMDAYMDTWKLFFQCSVENPVRFDLSDIEITAGDDVAFATAIGHCVNTDRSGQREPLDFRLTIGLRKSDGKWRILHEHHSLPAE